MEVVRLDLPEWARGFVFWVDGVDPGAAVGGTESEAVRVGGVGVGDQEVDFFDFCGGGEEGVGV